MEENNMREYEEISVKELIMTLYEKRKLIIGITALVLVLTFAVTIRMNNAAKEAQVLISINHGQISEGKNPDGTAFEPYDMIQPFILKDVIDSLDLTGEVSINDIRKNVTIEPIIPKSIKNKEEFMLEKEGTSLTYHPNEFIIKVSRDDNSNISSDRSVKIANSIVRFYSNYFTDEYISAKPLTNRLIDFNIDDYDYSDISEILNLQLREIKAYNNKLASIDSDFRSKETGMSFTEIENTVDIIEEIDLNRIDSLISNYKLTKDEEKLRIYYEYVIKELKLQQQKLKGSSNVSTEMLSVVESSEKAILESITGRLDNSKNSYFSQLILRSIDLGDSTASIDRQIRYYEQELAELDDSALFATEKAVVVEEVESLIKKTEVNIKKWIDLTNNTSKEFYSKLMTRAVRSLSPAEVYSDVNVTLNLAIGLVLGLMLSIFAAFMQSAWEKE